MKNGPTGIALSSAKNEQYEAYRSGAAEGKTVESIHAVERIVRNVIYPKVKFLSDDDHVYERPDFTGGGGPKTQSVAICDKILSVLGRSADSVKSRVLWWVAYRKVIRRKITRLRLCDVHAIKCDFQEGKLYKARLSSICFSRTISSISSSFSPVLHIALYCQLKLEAEMEAEGRGSDRADTPFRRLYDLCNTNETFADELLDHQNIDLAVFAEYLSITGPVVSTIKKSSFKETCVTDLLSNVLTVPQEAFALLILENGFDAWKWCVHNCPDVCEMDGTSKWLSSSSSSSQFLATQSPNLETEVGGVSTSSSSSPSSTLASSSSSSSNNGGTGVNQNCTGSNQDNYYDEVVEDDYVGSLSHDSSTQVAPGLRYQYTQLRSDKKPGAGPWTPEGMIRYNSIVDKVVTARKARARFEDHLRNHFRELDARIQDSKKYSKRKIKRGDSDDDGSPKKVVVIDLFTADDSD